MTWPSGISPERATGRSPPTTVASASSATSPALTAIRAPTLVIVAEADPIFPPPHAEALAEGIPGARAVRVPGMGHVYFSPGLPEHLADQILAFTQKP